MQCTCNGQDNLVDISQRYTAFVAGMRCLATGTGSNYCNVPGAGSFGERMSGINIKPCTPANWTRPRAGNQLKWKL